MKPYIGYEYKQATVPRGNLSQYLDGYESFGWQQDDRRPPSAGGRRVTIYLKRDRKIANKMELTRLQRHFEAAPCRLYLWVLRRQQVRADPLLEAQWEEVDRLCAKGQALL